MKKSSSQSSCRQRMRQAQELAGLGLQESETEGRSASMDLCSLKHAELAKHFKSTMEESCSREDNVKHDEGYKAVLARGRRSSFSKEQQQDSWIRFPHVPLRANDAVSAYTPLITHVGSSWIAETTRTKYPKHWDTMVEPVLPLVRNQYVRPLGDMFFLLIRLEAVSWETYHRGTVFEVRRKSQLFWSKKCRRHQVDNSSK